MKYWNFVYDFFLLSTLPFDCLYVFTDVSRYRRSFYLQFCVDLIYKKVVYFRNLFFNLIQSQSFVWTGGYLQQHHGQFCLGFTFIIHFVCDIRHAKQSRTIRVVFYKIVFITTFCLNFFSAKEKKWSKSDVCGTHTSVPANPNSMCTHVCHIVVKVKLFQFNKIDYLASYCSFKFITYKWKNIT